MMEKVYQFTQGQLEAFLYFFSKYGGSYKDYMKQAERFKRSPYCNCSSEETTGETQAMCCNICGRVVSEKVLDEETKMKVKAATDVVNKSIMWGKK